MATEPNKCPWWAYVAGLTCAAIGIWQGWTERKYPDLDVMSTFMGVGACWVMIAIGKGKL
jgi:hypothetical protein